jgi:hypothetical protein
MDYIAKPVSETTHKLYTNALSKIKKLDVDIDNIDINKLANICADNKYSNPSRYMLYNAILWYSKNNNKNINILDDLLKTIRTEMKEKKDKYQENKLFESETTKYIDWELILHIYSKLELLSIEKENDKNIYDEYFMLSLYILEMPRRIQDFLFMQYSDIIVDREPDCILWNDNEKNIKYNSEKVKDKSKKELFNKQLNYYVINGEKSYFIFNKYKTSKYHGSQVIEIPEKLDGIIKKYIVIRNMKIGDMFFNIEKSYYVVKMNKIFEKYINKKISVNILRKSRITYELKNISLNEKQKYIMAEKMAHSLEEQSLYKKIIDSDSEEDENIINQININSEKIINDYDLTKSSKAGRPPKYSNEEERKKARREAKKRFNEKKKIIND